MPNESIKIRAFYSPAQEGVELFITHEDTTGKLVWEKRPVPGVALPVSAFIDSQTGHKSLQILMDDLWACGVRPTEGKGSAGQLSATERHLDDMRNLVFKTTPKNLIVRS